MNSLSKSLLLDGASGKIECLLDFPRTSAFDAVEHSSGTVVIAHPHPLFGGTMDNKVVQTIARAFLDKGWKTVRFNFRGVGCSEGQYDEGLGESQDMLQVIAQTTQQDEPLAVAGFSFGAYVTSKVVHNETIRKRIKKIVLVGTAASRFPVEKIPEEMLDATLVLHGEIDDTVPLDCVLNWARPQSLPVVVMPGVGHFFHGQLTSLKRVIYKNLLV